MTYRLHLNSAQTHIFGALAEMTVEDFLILQAKAREIHARRQAAIEASRQNGVPIPMAELVSAVCPAN